MKEILFTHFVINLEASQSICNCSGTPQHLVLTLFPSSKEWESKWQKLVFL